MDVTPTIHPDDRQAAGWEAATHELTTVTGLGDKRHLFRAIVPGLPATEVATLSDLLYSYAVWLRNNGQAGQSFKAAQVIHLIGRARGDPRTAALGDMVRGDARNAHYRYPHAWFFLTRARHTYQEVGDGFGASRPVIGMLLGAVALQKVPDVLEVFPEAETFFRDAGDYSRLITLYRHRGILHRRQARLDDLDQADRWLNQALDLAVQHAPENARLLILGDLATIIADRGDMRKAQDYYQQIYTAPASQAGPRLLALQNMAHCEQAEGHYRAALHRLNELLDTIGQNWQAIPQIYLHAIRTKIECHIQLNDFERAAELARTLLRDLSDLSASDRSVAWQYLAEALMALGDYEEARFHIHKALTRPNVDSANLPESASETQMQVMSARLLLAQLALRQGETSVAYTEAERTLAFFERAGRTLEAAHAHILLGRVGWQTGNDPGAVEFHAQAAADIAERLDAPAIRYRAYTLLGHARRALTDPANARIWYEKAVDVIDQVQRNMTVLLRPGFLGDKGEPFQALLKLDLEQTDIAHAFETLERTKARVFLEYQVANDAFDWTADPRAALLTEELDGLRADYMAFRTKAADTTVHETVRAAARAKVTRSKERMREIVHRLYDLRGVDQGVGHDATIGLADIQRCLPADTLLIEYYDDGRRTFAFTVDRERIEHHTLAPIGKVRAAFNQLEGRAQFKLAMLAGLTDLDGDVWSILEHPSLTDRDDNDAFNGAAASLYEMLIGPLAHRLTDQARLVIVPYGQLHYLPFNLLYKVTDQTHRTGRYLIEDHEVVILPTASLLGQPARATTEGNVIIYDDWDARLSSSQGDAEALRALLGGDLYDARQTDVAAILRGTRGRILHLIAHGQFDSAHPEFSFIQLGQRQVMMNDLMRGHLRFDLVTLTTCEAGKLKLTEYDGTPALGDDLVGLGRAFLYAGAQSLLVSRWPIGDGLSLPLLKHFYEALLCGHSKAAALRTAQRALHAAVPDLHPVFWGLFQLIGDAEPLRHTQPAPYVATAAVS